MHYVNCGSCRNFIVGTTFRIKGVDQPYGMGMCRYLQEHKAQIAHLPLPEQELSLKAEEIKLGIIPKLTKKPVRLTYPNIPRVCQKFIELTI